jgi:hypothetical protein
MTEDDDHLVSFTEALKLVGIGRSTLFGWVKKGWLSPVVERVRTGDRGRPGMLFKASDVVKLADERGLLTRRTQGRIVRRPDRADSGRS